ncbi:4-methyl-5(b-hydroxyethyl)-thiazole monophosphate biosynthesis protein [Spiroplasma corruscae]|uniref:4-methyl-5(B-hydroxyethyl)-thiazole monophosphate biosynthesis protein n=1 Tax=Spiroplasma corruscae TaxID=216934 RepID=A0A222ENL7_9MOLU|nr:DJ-1 family glyoxalase III [Spiroplasma corruscae]ASP28090.1 4-methyl-5(b-hydroxyethyl)-thiazole monophosphate biosynthesis protein [Spiroplasma corruscae]
MANVAIFLAEGFEDTEMVATNDVLNRAKKMFPGSFEKIDLVSITQNLIVNGANGITVKAHKLIENISFDEYDCLVLPGGAGVANLEKCQLLLDNLKKFNEKKKVIAAICAAPQILGKLGILDGVEVTHYPGCVDGLDKAIKKSHNAAITDRNIITGSSIGAALQFGLQIVDYFTSTEHMLELYKSLVFNN